MSDGATTGEGYIYIAKVPLVLGCEARRDQKLRSCLMHHTFEKGAFPHPKYDDMNLYVETSTFVAGFLNGFTAELSRYMELE